MNAGAFEAATDRRTEDHDKMNTTVSVSRGIDFHRLQTALFNGRPDGVPLLELGIDAGIKAALLGRPIRTVADDIEFMRLMGYDFIKIQPRIKFTLNRRSASPAAESGAPGYRNAPDRAWAAEHDGVITSWEDFEQYPWPRKQDIDYSAFERARAVLPDDMGIIGQYGDIFTTAWEMMGFENFALAMYEDPALVEALMGRVAELVLSMFDSMADMDWVGALWYSDDIAYTGGLMVSPDFLRERFFPLLAHIGALARRRKIPFIYHTDGVLWEVFDDIVAAGVTAIHPIEPKSMNIVEVKDRYGDRLCVCGNIDVDLLARGTPDDVRALVIERLETLAPRGGYCLGSSNSVPDYCRLENYLAMVQAVHDSGL
ncbi:MAG: hypothetical protein Kow0059_17310 [Candidatus Sumerlaeia bacterium]